MHSPHRTLLLLPTIGFAGLLLRTRVEVRFDGLVLRYLVRSRFVPYTDIDLVDACQVSFGRAVVTITFCDGSAIRLASTGAFREERESRPLFQRVLANTLAERIRRAMEAAHARRASMVPYRAPARSDLDLARYADQQLPSP